MDPVVIILIIFLVVGIIIYIARQKYENKEKLDTPVLDQGQPYHYKANVGPDNNPSPHNSAKPVLIENILKEIKSQLIYVKEDREKIESIIRDIDVILETYQSPLLVTILGEFSSGKSTFINALIKSNLLATKDVETTATITRLTYGKDKKVMIHFKDNTVKEVNSVNIESDLDKYTVENFEDEETELDKIKLVSISLKSDLLKNIDIADTPGFGSSLNRHTENTKNFIKYSDAIIWIFSADQFGKASEIKTLSDNVKLFKPIAIVNKIDMTPLKPGETYHTKFSGKLESIKHTIEKVFFVSAYNAINGLNGGYPKDSGFQDVINYFENEIIPTATRRKEYSIINKTISMGNDLLLIYDKINSLIQNHNDIITEFQKKKDIFERDLNESEKSIKRWNEAVKKHDEFYILSNLANYYSYSQVPPATLSRVQNYLSEYKQLLSDNSKIDIWIKDIDRNLVKLNQEYNAWEQAYTVYTDKAFGLKSLWDDFFTSETFQTAERVKLNKMAAVYEEKRSKHNTNVIKYNSFIDKTNNNRLNLYESVHYYINNTILEEINRNNALLMERQNVLIREEANFNRIKKKYRDAQKDAIIFKVELKKLFEAILNLSTTQNTFYSQNKFNSFNEVVEYLNTHKKVEAIDWDKIYTFHKIDGVKLHKMTSDKSTSKMNYMPKDTQDISAKEV